MVVYKNEIPYNEAMTCKYHALWHRKTISKKTNNDKVCLCRSLAHSDGFLLKFRGSFISRFTESILEMLSQFDMPVLFINGQNVFAT